MAQLVLDQMADAALWLVVQPDGTTPSNEITCTVDTSSYHQGEDHSSLRVTGTTASARHQLRRSITPVDLRHFDEVRLAIRGNRVTTNAAGRSFYLELRLGSAAAQPDTAANAWHRWLPVRNDHWQVVRLSLTDLPDVVRGAVDRIQLRCIDASASFTVSIDDLIAVRHEPCADVDAALIRQLHNKILLQGVLVPAQVHVAGAALPLTRPLILLHSYAVRFAEQRRLGGETEGDYTVDEYSLRPEPTPWDFYYAVEALAGDRQGQAALVDFVLRALPPRGTLAVSNFALPCENVSPNEAVVGEGFPSERLLIHYRVAAWQETGPVRLVRPAETIRVNIDSREVINA